MMITKGYIDEAIHQTKNGYPADVPIIEGLSSDRVRRLLNWLCKEGTNYLEIGVHRGSTFIPALWNNDHLIAQCIDIWTAHWALNDAQRSDFEDNMALYLPGRKHNLIEGDLHTIDVGLLTPNVDVYFYDGPHNRAGQYEAFAHYDPVFANRFIAIVDDWNNVEPREETRRAFSDLRYDVEAEWVLPATPPRDIERWWNGVYIAIVNKEGAR